MTVSCLRKKFNVVQLFTTDASLRYICSFLTHEKQLTQVEFKRVSVRTTEEIYLLGIILRKLTRVDSTLRLTCQINI